MQTQLAITPDGCSWFLLNASPDLRQQMIASPELAPGAGLRSTPVVGVVLTGAEVDCVMGLLHLREFQPLCIYSTLAVRQILTEENRVFRTLERSEPPVEWCDLPLHREVRLVTGREANRAAELRCTAIPLNGAYPDYVSQTLRKALPPEEAVVGLLLAHSEKEMVFAPGLPSCGKEWKKCAQESDLAVLDGTFWSDDELVSIQGSGKTAREMGHLPLSGKGGLLDELRGAAHARRVLIHINNTNPILDEDSPEHRAVVDAGWEIAYDGMEFVL